MQIESLPFADNSATVTALVWFRSSAIDAPHLQDFYKGKMLRVVQTNYIKHCFFITFLCTVLNF